MNEKTPTASLWTRYLRGAQGVAFALIIAGIVEFFFNDFAHTGVSVVYLAKVGRISVLFLLLYTIHRFALASLPTYRELPKDTLWLGIILAASVILVWFFKIFTIGFANYPGTLDAIGKISSPSLNFAIPYATGALLIQAVLGTHFGLVFSVCMALMVGSYEPGTAILVPYVLGTCLVACLSLSRFRSRLAYLRAGLNISLVALPLALASVLIDTPANAVELSLRIAGALANGVLCALLAAGLTPVVEYCGGYVTDMRLIEMATLDHALLKDLSIQAPGTWNHSMVMGMMIEAAAESIGANAVVGRVGAYFHDIGKIKKSLYFVENQHGSENRHDRLSPSMSALIIKSHVKEGIEMAREHRLPKIIEDLIPQHHGMNVIEYFYEKARKEAEEHGDDPESVDISLYTYPGPKPQTREAGLLMLADGIEAAARTLGEPTLDRIQGLVQKMINKIFSSGELDESDLTLRDLHVIAKSFTRVLGGIYHQRIAYAEPAEKVHEEHPEQSGTVESNAELGDSGAQKKTKGGSDERENREHSKEDLKRLGLQ